MTGPLKGNWTWEPGMKALCFKLAFTWKDPPGEVMATIRPPEIGKIYLVKDVVSNPYCMGSVVGLDIGMGFIACSCSFRPVVDDESDVKGEAELEKLRKLVEGIYPETERTPEKITEKVE
jgi:hypothetical protein